MFTLASTTDLMAQAQDVITSVSPYFLVAVGIPLGFYLVRKVISLIPKR